MLLDDAIAALNERLKAGRHRCRVERMNQRLYLRATLPSRSGGASSQQRLPIGNATPIELAQAEVLTIHSAWKSRTGPSPGKTGSRTKKNLSAMNQKPIQSKTSSKQPNGSIPRSTQKILNGEKKAGIKSGNRHSISCQALAQPQKPFF